MVPRLPVRCQTRRPPPSPARARAATAPRRACCRWLTLCPASCRRLLVQCATAQEIKAGVPFRQDTARALASTNTMDRWILAAANGATPNPNPSPNPNPNRNRDPHPNPNPNPSLKS